MPAQLVSLDEGMRILLDKPILLLGRDSECDIQFESRKVSRRHCCIAQAGDRLIVRDLGSTNGVRINGVRVVEGYLKDGDELSVGSHRYRVSSDVVGGQVRGREKKSSSADRPARPPLDLDEALLESSEEPIPLSDRARPTTGNKSREKKKRSRTGEGQNADAGSPIIPEQLGLAPSSDIALPSPPGES